MSIAATSPAPSNDQELLAVLGRVVGVEVGAPGGRHEAGGQPGVGVDRVAVRLDDVDRPRSVPRSRRAPGRGCGPSGWPRRRRPRCPGRAVAGDSTEPWSIGPSLAASPPTAMTSYVSARRRRRTSVATYSFGSSSRSRAPGRARRRRARSSRRATPRPGSTKATPVARRRPRRAAAVVDRDARRASRRRSRPRAVVALSPRSRRRTEDDRRPGDARRAGASIRRRRRRRGASARVEAAAVGSVTSSTVATSAEPLAARREVGDAGEVDRSRDLRRWSRRGRSRGRRAVVARRPAPPSSVTQQVLDRAGRRVGERRVGCEAGASTPPIADRRPRSSVAMRAVVVADDQPAGRSSSIASAVAPGAAIVAISVARREVVGPDLGPGRDVEPLAGPVVAARAASIRARLDDGAPTTGTPEIARGADAGPRPTATIPTAIAYLARCGWVHS